MIHSGAQWLQSVRGGRETQQAIPPVLIVAVAGPGRVLVSAGSMTIAELNALPAAAAAQDCPRTSLGDIALRQSKYKDATKFYNDAKKGAQDDKRLDLMWPAKRGLGRSLWLQAAQEKDPKKSMSLREQAVANYRESLATIETLRQGSLRADESRTTFLASIKDVFDEAATAYASLALSANPQAGAPLSGKALEYASEAFRINEQSRARSLLDLLAETDAAITEGVPAELLKRKQENLDRQQDIADVLTGINVSTEELKKKPSELDEELEKLQTEYEEIENQIRTASPRYATLTANKPMTLAEVQQNVLDDQTVLVEYALQPEDSYLFVVSKSAVNLFKLPARANVDKLAMDLRAQLIPSKLQRRIVGIDVGAVEPQYLTAHKDAAGVLYQMWFQGAGAQRRLTAGPPREDERVDLGWPLLGVHPQAKTLVEYLLDDPAVDLSRRAFPPGASAFDVEHLGVEPLRRSNHPLGHESID